MTSRTLQNSITLKSSDTKNYTCEFCSRSFVRETTLLRHVCEQRRRHQQRHDPAVQLGLRSFQEFYRLGLNKTREISYQEFSQSNFYLAFVKFGNYLRQTDVIDTVNYTRWLIRNNVRLDAWATDRTYERWLKQFVLVENPHDALTRSIMTMTQWAEKNSADFSGFFRYGNENQLVWLITQARISAWCIYCSESGRQFLERLSAEQLSLVMEFVNPEVWLKIINKNVEETTWMKQTLSSAGL